MNCQSCGTALAEGASFCPSCGNAVASTGDPAGTVGAKKDNGPVTWAIICAALALVILPPLLGGIAIYLGFQVKKKNQELGQQIIWGAVAATVVGMIIGALLFTSA